MTNELLNSTAMPLRLSERLRTELDRFRWKCREFAAFDSRLLRSMIGGAGVAYSSALRLMGQQQKALRLETSLHRGAFSSLVDQVVERRVHRARMSDHGPLRRYVDELLPQASTQAFFKDPERLVGKRMLVLKSPLNGEKGVLVLDYSFVFSLFARTFDVPQIAQRYHLVLEPSWSGYCDLDLLCYLTYAFPVFVQNYEPRDVAFVERLSSNLINIPIAANWWVDHRVFRPLPDTTRDADVLLISSWARYKRHDTFFAALARLRARGRRLKTVLIGYQGDMTRKDLLRVARYHGVADQIEIFERVPPEEVNKQLNRVKVNVVWSRREGINRAVIEGLLANTPAIMRHGFNYGFQYPYINAHTGCFATERGLPDRLCEMIDNYSQYAPRSWILEHMNPQKATHFIDDQIDKHSRRSGEKWTAGELAVKVTSLDAMEYWNEADRGRFEPDYAFLRSMIRRAPQ